MNVILVIELALIALVLFSIAGALTRLVETVIDRTSVPRFSVGDYVVVQDMEQRVVSQVVAWVDDVAHVKVVSQSIPTEEVPQ